MARLITGPSSQDDTTMSDEYTDGKVNGWPCNVSIIGDAVTGFDVQCAPYTDKDDNSAPDETLRIIEAINGSYKTKRACRSFVIVSGFQPDTTWGEMNEK